MMSNKKIITSAKILFGKPYIKGTRVSVEQILACLKEGWSHKKIISEFDITDGEILACIDFAYQSVSRTHFIKTSDKAYV